MKKNYKLKVKKDCSKEHLLFIRKQRTKTILVHLARILILVLLLGLWELSARLELADPFITSSPSRIVNEFISLYKSGSLANHILTTLSETVWAFLLSTLIGTVVHRSEEF